VLKAEKDGNRPCKEWELYLYANSHISKLSQVSKLFNYEKKTKIP
jgi:hypothetical protein